MKNGNWVPISKAFLKHLPHDRAYTELEAMYSIQCDYDEGNAVTVAGFSDLWRWSRNRVRGFLDKCGVEIVYPDMTMKSRNQKGHIAIHKMDINGTYNGHKRIIDNKQLPEGKDIKRTKDGHKKDISRSTTIDTKTKNKKKKELFSLESTEYQLAFLLFSKIKENNPECKSPDVDKWAIEIDKLLRIDGRNPKDVEETIHWCQQDEFWASNILSVSKLRKQFDQLRVKMKGITPSGPETEWQRMLREEKEANGKINI